MKERLSGNSLPFVVFCLLMLFQSPVPAATIWSLGLDDDSQEEFSLENNASNPSPGNPSILDDDYYFAGDYGGSVGVVETDEPITNIERALTDADPTDRFHWIQDTSEDLLVLTVDNCCNGDLSTGFAPLNLLVNGSPVASWTAVTDVDQVFSAAFTAVNGENVITLERAVGNAGWIQLDALRLDSVPDSDADGLSDDWENSTAGNLGDLASGGDFDTDGLDDEAEFTMGSDPTLADTDSDGLLDGVETNTRSFQGGSDTGTSPTVVDTDGGGVNDADEIANGTDPNLQSDDLRVTELWHIGTDDESQAEFSCENGATNDPPGIVGDGTAEDQGENCSLTALSRDDDYYLAGDYDSVGPLGVDEPLKEFERAVTTTDPTNRIHFQLDSIPSGALLLTINTTQNGGFSAGLGKFNVAINNNSLIHGVVNDGQDSVHVILIEAEDLRTTADAPNENVVTITRTDAESDGGWIQFDHISFQSSEDTDEDGLPDSWEQTFFPGDLTQLSAAGDLDGDNLSDADEFNLGTKPNDNDTDDDGLLDNVETNTRVATGPDDRGTDPLNADTDGDGLDDKNEYAMSTSPMNPDSDGDGLLDGVETNTGTFVSADDTGTDPRDTDTDNGGTDDFTEVTVDFTDPTEPLDDLIFDRVLRLGIEDNNQAEFGQENATVDPAPGSAMSLDDHYYTAGVYPDPIGEVLPLDPLPAGHLVTDILPGEPLANLERAVTGADTSVFIHFILEEKPGALQRFKVVVPTVFNDTGNNRSLSVKLNGREMLCPTPTSCPKTENQEAVLFITPAITAIQAGLQEGENTVEFSTTSGGGGWIQFDYIDLLEAPPDTSDSSDGDNLLDDWELSWDGITALSQLSDSGDFDNDNVTDLDEFIIGTRPTDSDSDDDGLEDGREINDLGTSPLDSDSDDDGLLDGAEVDTHGTDPFSSDSDNDLLTDSEEINGNPSTDPLLADSDGDTFDDREELRAGSDPNDEESVPPDFVQIFMLGEDNGLPSEFTIEDGSSNEAPGDPLSLDDDYYFSGSYDTVGDVIEDEPFTNFERGMSDSDPTNRIHFFNEEEYDPATRFRLTWDIVDNDSTPHDIVVDFNGVQIFSGMVKDVTNNEYATFFTASDITGDFNDEGLLGENIVTFNRSTDTGGWIQFDHVTLEFVDELLLPTGTRFRRGDCDQSGKLDFNDAIFHLRFLFLGENESVVESCRDACDSDDSGADDFTDDINSLRFLFLGQGDIPTPGPMPDEFHPCGVDPTVESPEELPCVEYTPTFACP